MKAIVVGGGIGGLSAAIALRQVGVEAVVFERAGEIREIGAGISLWSNATRALEKLGLVGAVRAAGVSLTNGETRTWRGGVISRVSADELQQRFGLILGIHRADLQGSLLAALPGGTVRLGARCSGFEQHAGGVIAHFDDGREERGDLLVGADGIFSTVRARLFGEERPRYAGLTAWRAVTRFEHELLPPGVALDLWGRGAEFGLLSLGRGRVYWFGTKNAPEGESDASIGRKRELLERFRDWQEPVKAAIEATEETAILRNDIYDREPLKEWGAGRVMLLGDAAHPMTPHLGQGACQAIEDAVVLADSLSKEKDVAPALSLYESLRIPRTSRVVRQSRRIGKIIQLESPFLCRIRDETIKRMPARLQQKQLDWILGHET